jgi:hypothetical protein
MSSPTDDHIMLAMELSVVVVVRIPTNSGSLTWCVKFCEYVGWLPEKLCKLCRGVVKSPTTGSCFIAWASRYSGKAVCVGVRCECIVGVAEVGVGYAVLLAKVEVVLRCGVAVGVVVGTVAEGVAFGIP